MEPLRRSTRFRKSPMYIDDGIKDRPFFVSNEGTVTLSIPKRSREDVNDNDYDPNSQGPAKRSKPNCSSALVSRRLKPANNGTVSAAFRINYDIWMVIIENCTPAVLRKISCLSKSFEALINKYPNLLVQCRLQTYELGLQALPEGITEYQFNVLLEGKGCMTCGSRRSTSTHWTWNIRWCRKCWEQEVISENAARQFLWAKGIDQHFEDLIIAALPSGMRDSRGNPRRLLEENEPFKWAVMTFSRYELETLYEDFEALTPRPPASAEGQTPSEQLAILTQYRQNWAALQMRREAFFNQHIIDAEMRMESALVIDQAVHARARKEKESNKKNRLARAEFFTQCAEIDLQHIPVEVIKISAPFLAATKWGTDRGTKRSWANLKPKIRQVWEVLCADTMWDHDDMQKKQDIEKGRTLKQEHAVGDGRGFKDVISILQEEPLQGETVKRKPIMEEEESGGEHDVGVQPYSIWTDNDLAHEYYVYRRGLIERNLKGRENSIDSETPTSAREILGPAKSILKDSHGADIGSLDSGRSASECDRDDVGSKTAPAAATVPPVNVLKSASN